MWGKTGGKNRATVKIHCFNLQPMEKSLHGGSFVAQQSILVMRTLTELHPSRFQRAKLISLQQLPLLTLAEEETMELC